MVHTERSIAGDRKSQFSIQGFKKKQKSKNPAQPKMIQIVFANGQPGRSAPPSSGIDTPTREVLWAPGGRGGVRARLTVLWA